MVRVQDVILFRNFSREAMLAACVPSSKSAREGSLDPLVEAIERRYCREVAIEGTVLGRNLKKKQKKVKPHSSYLVLPSSAPPTLLVCFRSLCGLQWICLFRAALSYSSTLLSVSITVL